MAILSYLENGEFTIFKSTNVSHGGMWAPFSDELILTNRNIICLNKGLMGGVKKVFIYPLTTIRANNGVPIVFSGTINRCPSLDLFFIDSEEHFLFQEDALKEQEKINSVFFTKKQKGNEGNNESSIVSKWISEISKQYTIVINSKNNAQNYEKRNCDQLCSKCGAMVENGASFCTKCGSKIFSKLFCSNCGALIDQDSKYCSKCGKSVE